MIDVLKRLAELDATNTNVVPAKTVVKENTDLAECGIMPEMGMMGGMPERPAMPASINMTAGSGEELSNMLATIMQLAGVHKVEPDHMGMDHDPMTLTAEPAVVAGPPASDGEVMRGVIDKMNPEMGDKEGEEETDEAQYDNTPADPRKTNPFDSEEFAHQENQPGQGDRMDGNMPKATMEQQLMADYKKFISEETDQSQDIDQFVNGNRPNFNGEDEEDFDKAQQVFVNFLKKKGINVDNIDDDAFPVLVAMCQGKMCAWYDLETAQGYVTK